MNNGLVWNARETISRSENSLWLFLEISPGLAAIERGAEGDKEGMAMHSELWDMNIFQLYPMSDLEHFSFGVPCKISLGKNPWGSVAKNLSEEQ